MSKRSRSTPNSIPSVVPVSSVSTRGGDKYNLYYTLNQKIKSTPLGPKQKSNLKSFLNSCDFSQQEAVILLIVEHSKVADEYTYDSDNLELPYGLYESETDVSLLFDDLPVPLQWILHKFSLTTKKK